MTRALTRLVLVTAASLGLLSGAAHAAVIPSSNSVAHLIPASAAGLPTQPLAAGPVALPFRTANPRALAAGKRRAQQEYLNSPQPFDPPAQTAPWRGLSWAGLSGAQSGGFSPPDGGGSVGPNHFFQAVNSVLAVYDRRTLATAAGPSSLAAFFPTSTEPCDPQVEWDNGAQRWVFMAIECSSGRISSTNAIYVAFTKSTDPTDLANGWCKYTLATGAILPDYPKMGKNNSDWGVGVNNYHPNYVGSQVHTFQKPANGTITSCPSTINTSTSAAALTSVSGKQPFTVMAANQVDEGPPPPAGTASDAMWLIGWQYPGGGTASTASVFKFTRDAAGTATYSAEGDISVTPYAIPADVPQPGTSSVLDSSDTRGYGLTGHADPRNCGGCEAVWGGHDTNGPGGRSQISWNEFNPAACTGTAVCPSTALVQDGQLNSPSLFYFNGNVAPDGTGYEAVVNFNSGSSSRLAQLRAVSHTIADPLGGTHGQILLATSAAADNDFTCGPRCRWGDYPAVSPDPTNNGTVWNMGMVNGASGNPSWLTRNFAITPGEDQVWEDGTGLHVVAPSGARKTLVVSGPSGGLVTISDSNVSVTAVTAKNGALGGACTQVSDTQVTCPSAGMKAVRVWLGDQTNSFDGSGLSLNTQVVTAPGNDTIKTGSGNDLIQLSNDGAGGYVDNIDCGGGGTNTVYANSSDTVNANCQVVHTYP